MSTGIINLHTVPVSRVFDYFRGPVWSQAHYFNVKITLVNEYARDLNSLLKILHNLLSFFFKLLYLYRRACFQLQSVALIQVVN